MSRCVSFPLACCCCCCCCGARRVDNAPGMDYDLLQQHPPPCTLYRSSKHPCNPAWLLHQHALTPSRPHTHIYTHAHTHTHLRVVVCADDGPVLSAHVVALPEAGGQADGRAGGGGQVGVGRRGWAGGGDHTFRSHSSVTYLSLVVGSCTVKKISRISAVGWKREMIGWGWRWSAMATIPPRPAAPNVVRVNI